VQRRRRQPLLSPNDVGNVHQVVVHDVGEVRERVAHLGARNAVVLRIGHLGRLQALTHGVELLGRVEGINHGAAQLAGQQVVVKGRPYAANVQRASRRRGKTHPNRSFTHNATKVRP
nr:hypothetical protein [Tanacetum cinerariifolium]